MSTLAQRFEEGHAPSTEDLTRIKAFDGLSPDEFKWLAAHMKEVRLDSGEIVIRKGDRADYMVVVLSGEFRSELDDGRNYTAHAGLVTGMLPFSRLTEYPGNARATQPTRLALLSKNEFPEMLERIPLLQPRLVAILNDRVREATRAVEQRDKLTALGKLAAGLAHELNNPASAAQRAAENLRQAIPSVRTAALKLDKNGLPQAARIYLAELERDWKKVVGPPTALDSLERSDREEALSSWLEARGIDAAWELAPVLVDLGCTTTILDDIAEHVPHEFLKDVLTRTTGAFTIGRLAEQIVSATSRISDMVRAIKEYSYMDRAPEQCLDIHDGIDNTLIMLHHDLKQGIEVVRDYDRSLPKVVARGGELNQIWTNLIMNAVDAMKGKGKLIVRTMRDHNCARVEIVDNGSGIPARDSIAHF